MPCGRVRVQALIMQTPVSYIFKVRPLTGAEWGACIAIGVGVWPYCWTYRLLLRPIAPHAARFFRCATAGGACHVIPAASRAVRAPPLTKGPLTTGSGMTG